MYIVKRHSRRTADADRYMWVVGGAVWCSSIEHAVDVLMTLQADMVTVPSIM
jgi:hypothetical protein